MSLIWRQRQLPYLFSIQSELCSPQHPLGMSLTALTLTDSSSRTDCHLNQDADGGADGSGNGHHQSHQCV